MKLSNKYVKLAVIILPILVAVICLAQMVKINNQAFMPVPKEYVFTGEYSYDGEHWYPYNEDSDISALEGNLVVRGHFDSDIPEGGILNFYCNHIGVSLYVNGELLYIDTPSELKSYGMDLMASMCGKNWSQLLCPEIVAEDEIEIRLINYHNHGNEMAYKEVLSSFLMTPPDNTILEVYLKSYIEPFKMIGTSLLIVAMLLLGASISAFVFKSGMINVLFKIGAATLFTAGYIVFDVMMLYFADELLVVNTYGGQLCLMLAVYFIGLMICDALKENYKKVAELVMVGSGIINLLIIIAATIGKVLLYDTVFYWELAQYVISITLSILCILQLREEKKFRIDLILFVCTSVAIIIDMADVVYVKYCSGLCFKAMYVIVLIFFLFLGVKQIVLDHKASVKNKKLKEELDKSRIAVMLSQLQPHFLYNSLSSIYYLCDIDAKKAQKAIKEFSVYLRNNLDSIKNDNLISLEEELRHVDNYLKLEQLYMGDYLQVEYDIHTDDIFLPALALQPLVENAVKHGIRKLSDGGKIWIYTEETDKFYKIIVKDNGRGYDLNQKFEDGRSHTGILNLRERLNLMCNGELHIESEVGSGTTATIFIPK